MNLTELARPTLPLLWRVRMIITPFQQQAYSWAQNAATSGSGHHIHEPFLLGEFWDLGGLVSNADLFASLHLPPWRPLNIILRVEPLPHSVRRGGLVTMPDHVRESNRVIVCVGGPSLEAASPTSRSFSPFVTALVLPGIGRGWRHPNNLRAWSSPEGRWLLHLLNRGHPPTTQRASSHNIASVLPRRHCRSTCAILGTSLPHAHQSTPATPAGCSHLGLEYTARPSASWRAN